MKCLQRFAFVSSGLPRAVPSAGPMQRTRIMQSLSSVVFVAALVAALYFCTAATRASFAASHEIQFFDLVSNRRSCLLIDSA